MFYIISLFWYLVNTFLGKFDFYVNLWYTIYITGSLRTHLKEEKNMSTKQRPTLLEYFLRLLLNQVITTVSPNGYQLKGTLVKFDPNSIILSTCQYTNAPKEALVENYLAIIPHVWAPTDTPHYPIMFPVTTSVRQ